MSFRMVCYLFGSLSTYGIMAQNFGLHAESYVRNGIYLVFVFDTPVSRFLIQLS